MKNRIFASTTFLLICTSASADPSGIPGMAEVFYLFLGIIVSIVIGISAIAALLGAYILKSSHHFLSIFGFTFLLESLLAFIFMIRTFEYGYDFLHKPSYIFYAILMAVLSIGVGKYLNQNNVSTS